MVSITQMKIPVPESSKALVQPIFMLLLSISRIKCKEFTYFQGNELSKLFQEKIFSYTQNNREQVFTRNIRCTCISFKCLKERGHTKSFVNRMYFFVKKPFANLLNYEYTGWMTVLSHSHLLL